MQAHLVRQSVVDRVPINDAEEKAIAAFLVTLDSLSHPFSQHANPTHVTGSAVVVGARGVLLLRHKRLGVWLQPGGHIDPGESPWEAARREAREETGLDVGFCDGDSRGVPELIHVDVHPAARGHTHLDLRYLLSGDDSDPSPPPEESQEIGWFGWTEAVDRAQDDRLAALISHLGRTGRSK